LDTDRILVFDQGQIVESGSYQDLVRYGGVSADLLRHAEEPASPNGKPAEEPALSASAS
jgi:hypothetical protein